jgi:cyclohexadieny/prephenate dehydrogenase
VRDAAEAVRNADLVILCVPVGAMAAAARDIAAHLAPGVVVSDVGSSKQHRRRCAGRGAARRGDDPGPPGGGDRAVRPGRRLCHLFRNRWCIVTPPAGADPAQGGALVAFWEALGAKVEIMDARHHDLVLAVTSHLPHLIAYTIVGTASDLEDVTRSEVIKYSAGGFRDFTRIAASDPTMWRDVFLNNKDAVLEMLATLYRGSDRLARRRSGWATGRELFDHFTRTRAIRRSIRLRPARSVRPPCSTAR